MLQHKGYIGGNWACEEMFTLTNCQVMLIKTKASSRDCCIKIAKTKKQKQKKRSSQGKERSKQMKNHLTAPNGVDDGQQIHLSHAVAGIVKWYSHSGKGLYCFSQR